MIEIPVCLTQNNGVIANVEYSPIIREANVQITGEFPVATTLDLPIKLSALTSGKAKLRTWFSSYKTCPTHLGKTRAFKGISPLDRAKYILKARKALG